MYRRPKFLEVLLDIRREMALDADYDVDLFAELARTGSRTAERIKPNSSKALKESTESGAEAVELSTSTGA